LMDRMGTTEEVARLCLFIAAEASFTTGVDHIVSGGAELGYGRKNGR
jgi:NAD(P)-dependent dehydrogenase (short-subunit alcohol dehydrogenase family)